MRKAIYFIVTGLSLMIGGCGLQKPDELEKALEKAGSNRIQLEGVLRHFEKDPQKYEAASYLIRNMPYHHTIEGDGLEDYRKCYRLYADKKEDAFDEIDSILNKCDGFSKNWSLLNDGSTIDSIFLIHHIEKNFRMRDEFPWCHQIPDDIFNRYVLPYRIDNELLTSWQDTIRNLYEPLLDSLLNANETNSLNVAQRVLNEWNKTDFKWTSKLPSGICLGLDNVFNHSGACIDYAHAVVYLMRSFGIPSGIDYVPMRGQNNASHYWPFIIDENGVCLYSELDFEKWNLATNFDIKAGKIFRNEFGLNEEIAADINEFTEIPDDFRCPLFSDVSTSYKPSSIYDVTLRIPEETDETLWLGMSVYRDWIPVSYSKDVKENLFENMIGGTTYCVGKLKLGKFYPVMAPFVLDSITGDIRHIVPEKTISTITCFTKFPVDASNGDVVHRMIGGVIEGSDNKNFSKRDTVHIFTGLAKRKVNYVNLEKPGIYRYYRYRGAKDSYCNIAELGFFENVSDVMKLKGKIFGTSGSWNNDTTHTFDKAFDNDPDTSFDCVLSEGGEIGMDMGKPTRVEKILYAPRHRDNYVREGDMYELFYYDSHQQWRSAGRQVAVSDSLDFEVPRGTLYYLKNHTRGKDERIFEYDFDKREQIFR